MKQVASLSFLLLWFNLQAPAQSTSPVVATVRQYRQAHETEILREFAQLLAIPNVSADLPNVRRNAEWIVRMLARRGLNPRLLEVPGASPAVYGELLTPGATQTLIFYAHYDGQPVEPAKWAGGDPFAPVLRTAPLELGGQELPFPAEGQKFNPEWRLFARGAADDRAPIMALVAALDAMRAHHIQPTANFKFFFEGEEEVGSTNLRRIIDAHRELLKGDVWLICDGPVNQNRMMQLYFGVRGVIGLELTVYGPRRELHSGHYGNWAPNPALRLAQLLATMKDEDGRVLIEGWYDRVAPLSGSEKQALAEAPDNDEQLKQELLLGSTEGQGRKLNDLINLPSLNIRGLSSGSVGATARNVVPATATASLDIRLVKGLSPEQAITAFLAHLRKQGWHLVDAEPDEATRLKYAKVIRVTREEGYPAARTSMDLPISQQIVRSIESAGGPVIKMPTLGGSVPLYVFTDVLQLPAIGVPIANHDNNQHAANENLRLQNLWDGIEIMAVLLTLQSAPR
ncbi:MAG TPA: M20/M25/M40 family metallo-hydrolase [Blastocatellia bacterium]|nr:M20/M25/M40 family metallo-hydrolase [Blastocatellia bacterium]